MNPRALSVFVPGIEAEQSLVLLEVLALPPVLRLDICHVSFLKKSIWGVYGLLRLI